ncbi:hypothetical protein O1L60_35535 [Streptomyces diastatochromogenes]|nr:hypothetical protein [Streptomyces diastatochromogenes]
MSQNHGRCAGGSCRARQAMVSTNAPGLVQDRPSSAPISWTSARALSTAPGSWAATQSAYVVDTCVPAVGNRASSETIM